jgi:hypothetical protein
MLMLHLDSAVSRGHTMVVDTGSKIQGLKLAHGPPDHIRR